MENKTIKLLNSNLEIALRLLVIMNVHKKTIERDRLVAYEYFVIHSGDIKNAPSSIHPDIPYRASIYISNHQNISNALNILLSKELVVLNIENNKFEYQITKAGEIFVQYMTSEYYNKLNSIALWVCDYFKNYSDEDLNTYIECNIGKWGNEFTKESILDFSRFDLTD